MKNCHRYAARALCSVAGMLFAASAFAADADVTGLVPTIWWDFETQPDAAGLTDANKGSASITFSNKGTASYEAGVTNGWALNTDGFSPYSAAGGKYSTAGHAFTVSAVMTLGTLANGVTLNVRCETAEKDLVIRRGAEAGSLVIGLGPQKSVSTHLLNATFADGDAAFHLVSIVAELSGTSLYVDGNLVTNTTEFSLCSASGCASRMQFGERLSANQPPEVAYGGLIDDLRIHDAALTPAQMKAIAVKCGLVPLAIISSGAPTIDKDSFRMPFNLLLNEGDAAEAAIVYGTDAALSTPSTNVVGSALPAGSYTASLTGLASGTTYWWKLVATNGVNQSESDVGSFRTLDAIDATAFDTRVPITISGYTGASTLTNFPVLVKLAAGVPVGFDYADCTEDGADIRFSAADGLVLPHEIDTWNTNGESFVWVKIPAISGTGTTFSMYYGAPDLTALPAVDPHDVWTAADHRAVWHFATNAAESAQGLVASTATGTPSYENDGAVGKCWQSAGEAWLQYANEASWSRLGPGSTLTISVWAKFDSSSYGYNRILSTMSTWEQPAGYELTVQDDVNEITVGSSGKSQYQKVVSPGPSDEMVYLTAVYNADDTYADLYVNGVLQEHKLLNPVVQPTEAMTVACVAGGGNVWNGKLDELRLHAAAESADWVKACYDTMAAPSSFAVLSPAESTDPNWPSIAAISESDANGTATFAVTLGRPGFGGAVPTYVSVFYGTNGVDWTEISLGSTNEVGTLTGTASGFAAGVRYLWYAVATATSGSTPTTATSAQRSFVARAFDPTGYYKSFTATVVWDGAPAENVPVPIRISEAGINGFDYDDVTASRFEVLDAGGQLLPYEIDTWNTDGESILWTRLPVYENGATVTVRYGAPFANAPIPATNVWAGYAGVWHMNETYGAETAATGLAHDSSGNGLDATPAKGDSGNLAQMVSAPGVVGNARVNATSDTSSGNYLSVPNYDSLALGDTFAVSGWFKATIINGYPRLLSRKTAYNTDNGWELENGNGNAKAFSARGASGDAISLNTPSYDNAWVHIALVYNGTTLSAYANGSPCGSGTIAAATDNGKSLSFGNNSNGSERSLAGLYDEIRLLDATPSAERIAAEYHAMADAGAISFSSVSSSDISAPVLGIPSVAGNSDGSFTVSVEVSENTPASIVCIVGETEVAMTTSGASFPATYTATFSQLVTGTHVATVRATATSGTVVSSTCPTAFHAGSLTIVKQSDADEGTLTPGGFRISRADADPTGLPALTFDVAFSGPGLAAIVEPTVAALTIPAGAAYVDVSVTPIYTMEVDADAALTLSVSGAFIGTSSSGSIMIVNATFDPWVRYVATTGSDENHGGTPDSPKKTIGAAVDSLASVSQTFPCTVHVAPGLYPISNPIVVTNAIRVLADDPDPSRTVVSNTFDVNWGNQNKRICYINHPDAFVANLTMQKGQYYYGAHGGNICIGSAGGTVSNCVIEAGATSGNAQAAGAYLEGGTVTHSIFRKNRSSSGTAHWDGKWKGVLYMKGSSRVENCLFADNSHTVPVVLIGLAGSSAMRNCTIVDTGLASTNEYCNVFAVLNIESQNATVQNVVVAGVTNTIDGATCSVIGSTGRFLNGAFDGDATDLPAGTVTGTASSFFKDYENGDYTPSFSGPLANVGVEYEGMAAVDLAGKKRKVGKHIDIGCYECQKVKGFFILVQ